jgi:hypothetical protein
MQFIALVRQVQEDINKDRKLLEEQGVRLNERERALFGFITHQTQLKQQFSDIEEELKMRSEPTVGAVCSSVVNREAILFWIREQPVRVTENMLYQQFGVTRHKLRELGGINKLRSDALSNGSTPQVNVNDTTEETSHSTTVII